MAEAACGPSNPLQNFQKHTTVDRTLQQDRTFLRQSPTQGFRSSSPLAGSLDAEFEAFQAPQPLFKAQQALPRSPQAFTGGQLPGRPQYAAPLMQPAVQPLPNWALDFQHLNISRPEAERQFQPKHISGSHDTHGGWHREFMAQGSGLPQERYHEPAQTLGLGWQPQFQNQPYIGETTNYLPPPMQQHQANHINEDYLNFDEAGFEKAFDAARQAVDGTESKSKGKERVTDTTQPAFSMGFACTDPGDVMGEYDFDQHAPKLGLKAQDPDLAGQTAGFGLAREDLGVHEDNLREEFPKIGSDTIPADNGLSPAAESDELSRTAGVLLDTLKDERNTKFQNSAFLGLMRQLRDKEIRIEGDQMVSAAQAPQSEPSHPGGRYYPYDAFDENKSHQKESNP